MIKHGPGNRAIIKRMNFPLNGLELYLPLGYPELSGSTITSKDLNAISCTVTGATHTPPTHRIFDGTDDYIDLGDVAALELEDWTIALWVQMSAVGAWQTIFSLQHQSAGAHGECGTNLRFSNTNTLQALVYVGTNSGKSAASVVTFSQDTWYFVMATKVGTALDVYRNGGASLKNTVLSTATMDYTTDVSKKTVFGATWSSASSSYGADFTGFQGEGWVYNRGLSVAEGARIYRMTKWRYV